MGELLSASVQLAWATAASTTTDHGHQAHCSSMDQGAYNWNSQPLSSVNTSQLVYWAPYSTTEGTCGNPQKHSQNQAASCKGVVGKSKRGSNSSSSKSSNNKKEYSSRSQKNKKMKDVTEKKEFGECCVCMDRGKSHALVPCGHLCACVECAAHLVKKSCLVQCAAAALSVQCKSMFEVKFAAYLVATCVVMNGGWVWNSISVAIDCMQ